MVLFIPQTCTVVSEKGYIFLTFDDASEPIKNNALPIMNEFGFKGTTFFTTKYHMGNLPAFVEAGWEIGCRTYSHPHLNHVSEEQLYQEIVQPKIDIEQSIANVKKVITFAYPFGEGWNNETVASLVNQTYKYVRPYGGKTFDVGRDEICIENAQKAVEYVKGTGKNAWLMFHAVNDTPTVYITMSLSSFRKVLEIINASSLTPTTWTEIEKLHVST